MRGEEASGEGETRLRSWEARLRILVFIPTGMARVEEENRFYLFFKIIVVAAVMENRLEEARRDESRRRRRLVLGRNKCSFD